MLRQNKNKNRKKKTMTKKDLLITGTKRLGLDRGHAAETDQ